MKKDNLYYLWTAIQANLFHFIFHSINLIRVYFDNLKKNLTHFASHFRLNKKSDYFTLVITKDLKDTFVHLLKNGKTICKDYFDYDVFREDTEKIAIDSINRRYNNIAINEIIYQ